MSEELNKEISFLLDKIISRITNFIHNYNNNNKLVLLDKLKSIDYFIKCKLHKEYNNDKNSQKERIPLLTDINEKNQTYKEKDLFNLEPKDIDNNSNFIPSYQFIINKLKRKIKEQHENNKIKELGYLETIALLQSKIKTYEEKNNTNRKNNNLNYKIINKSNNKNLFKSEDNKKQSANSFIRNKQIQINLSQNQIKKLYKNKINKKINI